MLLEFRVKNFRSFRDEQVLSLVATKDKAHADTHLIETGIKAAPHAGCSAVLYGPNAGGKSNFITAMKFVAQAVANSATKMQEGQSFSDVFGPFSPFMLDMEKRHEPSEFEITFLNEGIRYQYILALTSERVLREELYVYKTNKPQKWFSRKCNIETKQDEYEFGSSFEGKKKDWQSDTRSNALFLSVAVKWNSDQLKPVFSFLTKNIVINDGDMLSGLYTYRQLNSLQKALQQEGEKEAILEFMRNADFCISEIIMKEDAVFPTFKHKTLKTEISFEFRDESLGTQKYFILSKPVLDTLKYGHVLVIDELDSSMHPNLLRHLVRMFHNPALNTKGAQLVFSVHDTSLLNKEMFRRDQVWFVERNDEQASILTPLSDFKARKNEAFEKNYLTGRYGAIPILEDFVLPRGN